MGWYQRRVHGGDKGRRALPKTKATARDFASVARERTRQRLPSAALNVTPRRSRVSPNLPFFARPTSAKREQVPSAARLCSPQRVRAPASHHGAEPIVRGGAGRSEGPERLALAVLPHQLATRKGQEQGGWIVTGALDSVGGASRDGHGGDGREGQQLEEAARSHAGGGGGIREEAPGASEGGARWYL